MLFLLLGNKRLLKDYSNTFIDLDKGSLISNSIFSQVNFAADDEVKHLFKDLVVEISRIRKMGCKLFLFDMKNQFK